MGGIPIHAVTPDADLLAEPNQSATIMQSCGLEIQAVKVYAHQTEEADDETDNWLIAGNEAADRLASHALQALPPEVLEAQQEAEKAEKEYTSHYQKLVNFINFFAQVGVLATKTAEIDGFKQEHVRQPTRLNRDSVIQMIPGAQWTDRCFIEEDGAVCFRKAAARAYFSKPCLGWNRQTF